MLKLQMLKDNKTHMVRPLWMIINSLGPSDAIWRQRSWSTLAQVMAGCLTTPSHYMNQCWLIISKVEWHLSKGKFTSDNSAINHWNYLQDWVLKIPFKFSRGQWVQIYLRPLQYRMGEWLYQNPNSRNVNTTHYAGTLTAVEFPVLSDALHHDQISWVIHSNHQLTVVNIYRSDEFATR